MGIGGGGGKRTYVTKQNKVIKNGKMKEKHQTRNKIIENVFNKNKNDENYVDCTLHCQCLYILILL